jgi:hypothetical protein
MARHIVRHPGHGRCLHRLFHAFHCRGIEWRHGKSGDQKDREGSLEEERYVHLGTISHENWLAKPPGHGTDHNCARRRLQFGIVEAIWALSALRRL